VWPQAQSPGLVTVAEDLLDHRHVNDCPVSLFYLCPERRSGDEEVALPDDDRLVGDPDVRRSGLLIHLAIFPCGRGPAAPYAGLLR